ncbi:hypothetical protein K9U00_06960 [Escherichia coli]|nr:phage antirepressor N-terminal domain-containing protein [Salmonella enterica]MCJ1016903.1 hypothetical protein [Escherichia coli]MCJ1030508.1 hypothetical protein [Escherichia coli]MCJ1079350.1 hypothetical protein [Escherichia coli]
MKPIVEGMGLAWQTQHRKLSERFKKGITEMVIPSVGGAQAMICLALRKLAAGATYVAMRKIVENIGIDWTGQSVKLRKQKEKFGCRDISIPSKGGVQKMLCIPLKKLNGWLFSINPEKVRADIRDKLIQYQDECDDVD